MGRTLPWLAIGSSNSAAPDLQLAWLALTCFTITFKKYVLKHGSISSSINWRWPDTNQSEYYPIAAFHRCELFGLRKSGASARGVVIGDVGIPPCGALISGKALRLAIFAHRNLDIKFTGWGNHLMLIRLVPRDLVARKPLSPLCNNS